uniref:Ubiquitin-like domain-containing protein n=1 Tax=Ditylenchus dipsaci TaxID=166011 RepID=A0A915DGV1_9BILA
MASIERNNSSSSDFTQDTLGHENCDDQEIVVFFKTFREEMLSLTVRRMYTVQRVKIKLSHLTNVPLNQIRLSLFGYGKLDVNKTLNYYYIQNGATIVLQFRSPRNSISVVGRKLQKLTGKNKKLRWDDEDSADMQSLRLYSRPLTEAELEAKYKQLEKSENYQKASLNEKVLYRTKSVDHQRNTENIGYSNSSVHHSNQFGSESTYVGFHQ